MKPSLGRIVLVHTTDGIEHPAIIVAVHSDICVSCQVFHPSSGPDGMRFESSLLLEQKEHGWRWPPRVE